MLSFFFTLKIVLQTTAAAAPRDIHWPLPRQSAQSCTCANPCDQRKLWDLVWGCLFTIFACTWVSIHPNIPSPRDSTPKVMYRRLKIMLWGLIAPELILVWAGNQWIGARHIRHLCQDKEWTVTHGFFIQMGGFVLHAGNEPLYPLGIKELQSLCEEGEVDWPSVTEDAINDRSKGDEIAKGIVLLQTSWFIIQCIARGVQRLGITELEIVTLSFAALNGMMYYLWWNKPLDVRSTVPVYLKSDPSQEGSTAHRLLHETRTKALADVKHGLGHRISYPIDHITGAWEEDYKEKKLRVPSFFTEDPDEADFNSNLLAAPIFLAAIAYGAIHCIAWSFRFPSRQEQILWRVSSIILTVTPIIVGLFGLLYEQIPERWKIVRGSTDTLLTLLTIPAIVLYPVARIVLLIVSLTALRNLSPDMLADIQWASFIPHV